jgi:multiple antibiotic resistance protein
MIFKFIDSIPMHITLVDTFTVFMVLFAVIDITGSIPIILDLKRKTGEFSAVKATLISFVILAMFLIVGEPLLGLFGVDISSFAIAGALILFFLSLEMVLGIQLFKYEYHKGTSSIVPLAFPLIAGAGAITTLISLKSQYSMLTIMVALILNMILVYFVLKATRTFERILGEGGIQVLQKIFGVILLSIAVKLFISNTGINIGHGG